jgi:K+ transporter
MSSDRRAIEPLGHGFYRLTLRYGFMEEPDVQALGQASAHGFPSILPTPFFLGVRPSSRRDVLACRCGASGCSC